MTSSPKIPTKKAALRVENPTLQLAAKLKGPIALRRTLARVLPFCEKYSAKKPFGVGNTSLAKTSMFVNDFQKKILLGKKFFCLGGRAVAWWLATWVFWAVGNGSSFGRQGITHSPSPVGDGSSLPEGAFCNAVLAECAAVCGGKGGGGVGENIYLSTFVDFVWCGLVVTRTWGNVGVLRGWQRGGGVGGV